MKESGNTGTLGKMLREHRKAKRFTLRQVEEATNISNAYLSQLENGKIRTPSANILYRLSELYRSDFNYYLEIAGIIEKRNNVDSPKSMEGHVFYSLELDEDEEKELLRYLQFLRSKMQDEKINKRSS